MRICVSNTFRFTYQSTLFFERGQKGVITAGEEFVPTTKMCILEDPHGERFRIQTETCSHEINPVTEHHEGAWKAYIGINGIEQLVEQKIIVKTYCE